jgi:hypothetical protein
LELGLEFGSQIPHHSKKSSSVATDPAAGREKIHLELHEEE